MPDDDFLLVTGLWVGDELPPMARLCMTSWIDHGCDFQLFCYKEYEGIPEGVRIRDANTILPESEIFRINGYASLAPFADLFRWKWLYEEGGFWIDMDVICLNPTLIPKEDILFYKQNDWEIGIAVLKFPPRHDLVSAMYNITYDPAWIAPWYTVTEKTKRESIKTRIPDLHKRRQNIPWGWGGPQMMTRAVRYFKLLKHAQPFWHCLQTDYYNAANLYNGAIKPTNPGIKRMWGTHLYGEILRAYIPKLWSQRTPDSMVSYLWNKHMIEADMKWPTVESSVETKAEVKMKCVYLVSNNEVVESAYRAIALGYEVELYPVTQNTSSLKDLHYTEAFNYIGRTPESAEGGHVRSLRASFIRMLTDTRYKDQENIVFCESDALPLLPASELWKLVQETQLAHPDIDCYRLFYTAVYDNFSLAMQKLPKNCKFIPMGKHKDKDPNTRLYWGTHAMLLPWDGRKKLAQVFSEFQLPTDTALCYAQGNDLVNTYIPTHNFFVQVSRKLMPADKSIACLLVSESNLRELQRQLWCILDQSYNDLHLFVAVTGISKTEFSTLLEPQFNHFIAKGVLSLAHVEKKAPLSNLLDTIRDENIHSYELFVILKDGAMYSHDCMEGINKFHRVIPGGLGSYTDGQLERNVYSIPRWVLSRKGLDRLKDYEADVTKTGDIDTLLQQVILETENCNRTTFALVP